MTPKREKFCLEIVAGKSLSDAYRSAFGAGNMKPATINNNAYKLTRLDEIKTRLAELRKPIVDSVQYGLREAMLEAEEAFKIAQANGNGGAMVAAVTLRAKLHGLLVERREIRSGALDDIPHESLVELKNALRGDSLH